MSIMIILQFVMRSLFKRREDLSLCYSGTIHPQHSWAQLFSLWIILNSPVHLWLQRPVSTGNRNAERRGKKIWGVRECMRVEDPQTLSSLPCLFSLTFCKYSFDPQCGIIFSFIPPLAVFLPLHLLFLPPLPQSCVSLPYPSTSLPPTFLSHSEELSVSVLPFIYCFNMLAGGERGGCCARLSVLSCHLSGQRRLPLTPTQLPVVSAWRTLKRRCGRKHRGSGELAAWSSTGTTTAGEWSRATVLLWWKLPTSQQWPSPLPLPVSRSPLPPFQLPDPCGRKQ